MMNSWRTLLSCMIAVAVGFSTTSSWADLPKLEPVPDINGVTVKGQEPRPREIEDAFNECLRAMDEEVRDISDHGGLRRAQINEQTEQCRMGKLSCLSAPRGPECRAFVEDYGS
jgi:hypothetical protein